MSASIKTSPPQPTLPAPVLRRSKRPSNSPDSSTTHVSVAEPPAVTERSPRHGTAHSQMLPLRNDLIPDELLATLRSTVYSHGRIGPPKLTKTPEHLQVSGIRAPDVVWHYSTGRKKYQYFLDQPTSVTGAGRDISFLCDALAAQRPRGTLPPMTDRATTQSPDQKDAKYMETLIPAEYHIVKNKGLKGLQCYDDKFTVLLEDEEKKLKMFPSMKPGGRLEAVQLMKVMDDMLDKAGVSQPLEQLTHLSQMQGLLELVRVEQNIYNIVFHELIRQVSVECVERGQLLAKLRQRYVALLDRIPQQLQGLHAETLAQRALDRRLTQEIICFKRSIAKLNQELSEMRVRDEQVSTQAERAHQELARALEQSQHNSDVLGEYHSLYELQRRRLEGQVAALTEERDLWTKVTYSLALKVIKLNNLQLVSRLHISAQTWSQTAEHCTVVLTTKNSEDLNHILHLTDQWKEQLTSFMENLRRTERNQCESIRSVQKGTAKWHEFCQANVRCTDVKFEKTSVEELFNDLKQWSMSLTTQCERYGGEDLLSGQEILDTLTHLQETWVEVFLQLFWRHPDLNGEAPKGKETMRELSHAVTELHKQLSTRISGESGIHRQMMHLAGGMEFWAKKLKSLAGQPEALPHSDWLKLEKALKGWSRLSEEALLNVDSTQPESEKMIHKPHVTMETEHVCNTLREFLSTQNNFFDNENLRLCKEVRSMDTLLIRWMVELLLLMAPDCHSDQEAPSSPLPEFHALEDMSIQKLEEDARNVAWKLDNLTKYITGSCQAIVEEEVQRNMPQDETEKQLHELRKLQRECGEWVKVCGILLSDSLGCPVAPLLPGKAAPQSATDMCLSSAGSPVDVHSAPESPEEAEEDEEGKEEEEEKPGAKAASRRHSDTTHDQVTDIYFHKTEEEGGAVEVTGGEEEGSVLKLVGHDGHIIEQTLGEETVQLVGTGDFVMRPYTGNAHHAYGALATVNMLQTELLAVEVRATSAEDRALRAEEDLQEALEKIQCLQRQLSHKPSVEVKESKGSAPEAQFAEKAPTPETQDASPETASSPKPNRGRKKR
ncbi:axonemal dynein light chain domain-containing protein 1 [Electrophorus electricus]|uniref:axonemal dynein light chain domain-containing protein 1 n=1 Tax=Electrophorus electricus TaxID=8005 RepID=UPI0015D0C474|nr:axonemal dynein light chain domain-containing protein 1 [Electrophorus electricus]